MVGFNEWNGGRAPLAGPNREVASTIFAEPGSDIVPGELIVQLDEGAAQRITESIPRGPSRGLQGFTATSFGVDDLDNAIQALGVTSITRLHPPAPVFTATADAAAPMASTFRLSFTSDTPVEQAVGTLQGVAGVQFAEPNRYRETYAVPNDPSFPNQWGLAKINCPAAWDRTTGSANIVVAVIDTGVDLDHPELAPLIVPGTDMVDLGPNPGAPAGFRFEGDFQGRDNVPQDEVGHGTHVAGTIACLSNNGQGVAGVTWSCRIMPVRVLARIVNINNPADVRGTGSAADIAAGIRWAVDNGARVLNLSLGGTTDTQVERDAIAYAIAHGAVVVAAMGNAFQQGNPTSFPGAYPDVVAVGAIDASDHRAVFSQTGPHIDVAAPGVGILSTVWNDGFTTMSGTSMASPHVAGVAALILSCNANLTGPQVADILRQTARPLRDNPADPVPNNSYGFGCVDAAAALARACPPRPSLPVVSCPSVVTICPTRQVNCPTRQVICRPSVITICPTAAIACASHTVACRPSVVTVCVTHAFNCPTSTIQCAVSLPVQCRPSLAVPCPSGPVCGQPPIGDPGPFGAGGGQADAYGWGGGPYAAFDPYSSQFQSPWGDEDWSGGQGGNSGGCCGG